jgi:hypothetical protein
LQSLPHQDDLIDGEDCRAGSAHMLCVSPQWVQRYAPCHPQSVRKVGNLEPACKEPRRIGHAHSEDGLSCDRQHGMQRLERRAIATDGDQIVGVGQVTLPVAV